MVEKVDMNPWWWLSFAEQSPPQGRGFLGAIIIRGTDFLSAVKNAHRFGINPGGEVQGMVVPAYILVPDWAKKVLLTREQCATLDTNFAHQLKVLGIEPEEEQHEDA